MSEKTISTADELALVLKERVSEKRYIHSLGVAQTTEMILKHYNCSNYEESWNGFSAGTFCGLVHDLAREMKDQELLSYCKENDINLSQEQLNAPVLAHGVVSADIAQKLVGNYPQSWKKAIEVHTTGESDMDDLALSLFVADFIEPSRTFLTDSKREEYLSHKTLLECEYHVLCDIISHWKEKGYHDASDSSLRLLSDLERKLGK